MGLTSRGSAQLDKIRIDHMTFYGTHGVLPEENRLGQRYYVDLELHLDVSQAAATDDLQHSVNYAEVYEVVKQLVEETEVKLIETLATNIAEAILASFAVMEVWVKVTKPDPPIKGFQGAVAVEITRDQK